MLIDRPTLRQIADGRISLAFRRWKRPTVKAGGTLLTSLGQLSIDAVDVVALESIDDDQARAAGYRGASELLRKLDERGEGEVYRVALRWAGPDPRVVLRERVPDATELDALRARLARMDARRSWTRQTLRLLRDHPAVRAADLAPHLGVDKDRFKADVRKLKGLGLTQSLQVGYRLSPRGAAVLGSIEESES